MWKTRHLCVWRGQFLTEGANWFGSVSRDVLTVTTWHWGKFLIFITHPACPCLCGEQNSILRITHFLWGEVSGARRLLWWAVHYLPFVLSEGKDCHYLITEWGRVNVSREFGLLYLRGALNQRGGHRRQVSPSSVYTWPVGRRKKPTTQPVSRIYREVQEVAYTEPVSFNIAHSFSVPVVSPPLAQFPSAFITSDIVPSRLDATTCTLQTRLYQKQLCCG